MIDRPNIILIVMDSARAANVSSYGYERTTTPNLDTLAREGALYEQAISTGCWTLPVHASLFTGLHAFKHGVNISKNAMPEEFPTLAGYLSDLGYDTACFSNNAYVSEITKLTRGFETVEDLWQVSNPRGIKRTKMWRLRRWLEQFGALGKPVIAVTRLLQRARAYLKRQRRRGDKGARLTNRKIESWLTGGRDREKPFFMFVNYMEPHEPYNPPQPYDQHFMPRRYSRRRVAQVGNNKEVMEQAADRKRYAENLEILQALYDGELNYLDHKIGELVAMLASQNLLENTVLVVTSDHGESLGEHGHIGHRMALYEQLVHVPLVIRYPARMQAGTRIKEQVSLIDLYPTLLELAGAEKELFSTNGFHSLLTPAGVATRSFVIAENTAPKSMNSVVSRMLRTKGHKFIWRSDEQHELYDLEEDPDERVNLIASEPELARQLREQLETWMGSQGSERVQTGEAHYDKAIQDHLQKLGYVD